MVRKINYLLPLALLCGCASGLEKVSDGAPVSSEARELESEILNGKYRALLDSVNIDSLYVSYKRASE
jgi:hypothetical protein